MTVYHTATQEDYDALMVELEENGYKWRSGRSLLDFNPNNWLDYRSETCVVENAEYLQVTYQQIVKGCESVIEYKAEKKQKQDIINKPSHYHKNGIDVIGFSEAQFSKEELKGFCRINAIKYITRFDRKNGVEDLEKAKFYIDKLIEVANG